MNFSLWLQRAVQIIRNQVLLLLFISARELKNTL